MLNSNNAKFNGSRKQARIFGFHLGFLKSITYPSWILCSTHVMSFEKYITRKANPSKRAFLESRTFTYLSEQIIKEISVLHMRRQGVRHDSLINLVVLPEFSG